MEFRRHLTSVAGDVFYDSNLDGIQQLTELDLPQWVVFLDSNFNGVVDGTASTFNSTGASFAIADKTTYTTSINVSGTTGTIADVDVRINLAHAYLADLDIFLTAPSGVKIELSTDNGGSQQNLFNTLIDDDAPIRVNGNNPGGYANTRFRPEFSMGKWNGSNINGTWTLEVSDDSLGDTGTFFDWGLTIRNGEPDATTYSDGTYLLETAASGSLNVRPVIQSGYVAQRNSATVNVATGGAAIDVDFGVRLPPSNIAGRVFNDLNANGLQDAGELGIAGRAVFLDLDNNGQIDTGEASVLTNASGDYFFSTVKPQSYFVRTVLPFGWTQTSPTSTGVVANLALRSHVSVTSRVREYSDRELIVGTRDMDRLVAGLGSKTCLDLLDAVDLAKTTSLSDDVWVVSIRPGYDAAKLAERFGSIAGVDFASPNYIYRGNDSVAADPREYTPNDPQFSQQTFHTRIGSTSAWDVTEGAGVKVAVIDDGVLLSHPDLSPNLWSNPGEIAGNGIDDDFNGYIDDKNGWDFTNSTSVGTGDSNPNPENGDTHGTHIAGVIAARSNNFSYVAGVAGKATIIPIRFFGTGAWTSTVIFNAFKYAADIGAKIVNVSYNVDQFVDPLDPTYNAAVEYLNAHNVLHINSAGNENALDPARTKLESTVYVAAVDQNDKKVTDSNYGSGVDLSAPGEPILSTTNSNGNASLGTMGGTSVAAAVASGVAALIWAKNPSWTRDQVAAQLIGSADNIDAANTPEMLGLLGSGRVNALKAVTQTLAPPTLGEIVGLPVDGGTVVVTPIAFEVRTPDVLDVASANTAGNWQMINAGADGTFGTADDSAVALNRSNYRVASNSIRFTLNTALPTGLYRFTAKSGASGLRDPLGRQLDGNSNGAGGDDRILTFTVSALAAARVVSPAPGTTAGGYNFGTRTLTNTSAPTVSSTVLTLDGGQRLTATFSEVVQPIPSSAITLRNVSNNTIVPNNQYWTYYDSAARTLTVQIVGGVVLADASYRFTLSAFGIVDLQGNAMASDSVFNFAFNRGDINRSGLVDFADLLTLAQHYGQAGVFSQGDTNFDGAVNFEDLLALSQRYGQSSITLGLTISLVRRDSIGRSIVGDLAI